MSGKVIWRTGHIVPRVLLWSHHTGNILVAHCFGFVINVTGIRLWGFCNWFLRPRQSTKREPTMATCQGRICLTWTIPKERLGDLDTFEYFEFNWNQSLCCLIGLKIGSKFSAPSPETERYNFAAIFVRTPADTVNSAASAKNATMQIVLMWYLWQEQLKFLSMQVSDHDLGAKWSENWDS